MDFTAKQIERFFRKQCTPREAAQVAAFLKRNPDVLDKYLSEAEWNEADSANYVDNDFWEETWEGIKRKKQRSVTETWLPYSGVAACVAVLVCLGYFWLVPNKMAVSKVHNKVPWNEKPAITAVTHKTIKNISNKPMHVLLQDGSAILVSPGATVEYEIPFPTDKRTIFLTGEALCTIAKDRFRPFTVYAGGLATTALGTRFKITSYNKGDVIIKLYSGKLVIHQTVKGPKGWNKSVYLNPGQQIHYDAEAMLVVVDKMVPEERIKIKTSLKATTSEGTALQEELNFNSVPLPDVLDKLALYFKVVIKYDTTQIKGRNFTGVISRSDSLSVVLNAIGLMNDLVIRQEGSLFIVHKK
jgi:transmembrane sensor